jgi:hypothetical protein
MAGRGNRTQGKLQAQVFLLASSDPKRKLKCRDLLTENSDRIAGPILALFRSLYDRWDTLGKIENKNKCGLAFRKQLIAQLRDGGWMTGLTGLKGDICVFLSNGQLSSNYF